MRILLVEDDKTISNNTKFFFEKYKFIVDQAFDLKQADLLLLENTYDILILDRMLPDGDGMQIVKKSREISSLTPIIMLTAKTLLEDKVEAFESGVDDYVTKPFQLPELLLRVRSVLRRSNPNIQDSVITVGPLSINTDKFEVTLLEKVLEITGKTYSVIEYLAMNLDRVVSRDELCERVLDVDVDSSNLVDVHIAYIRKSLGKRYGNKLIKTVKGRGYMLCSI